MNRACQSSDRRYWKLHLSFNEYLLNFVKLIKFLKTIRRFHFDPNIFSLVNILDGIKTCYLNSKKKIFIKPNYTTGVMLI